MNVMTRAWEIAKGAVAKFGGKVSEFFPQALVMAWAESRNPAFAEVELKGDTKRYRTWMAVITGVHPVYKLDRQFINPDGTDQWGDKLFRLKDGFYEYNNGSRRGFFQVSAGRETRVEKEDVYSAFGVA